MSPQAQRTGSPNGIDPSPNMEVIKCVSCGDLKPCTLPCEHVLETDNPVAYNRPEAKRPSGVALVLKSPPEKLVRLTSLTDFECPSGALGSESSEVPGVSMDVMHQFADESPKAYSRSKWLKHSNQLEISRRNHRNALNSKTLKAQQRKAKLSRSKQKPNSTTSPVYNAEGPSTPPGEEFTASERELMRLAETDEGSMNKQIRNALACMVSLSVAESWAAIMASLAQFLIAIVPDDVYEECAKYYTMREQAPSTIEFFRDKLNQLRSGRAALSTVPFYKSIINCLAIAFLAGFAPSSMRFDSKLLNMGMEEIERRVDLYSKETSLVDILFNVLDHVLEWWSAAETGSITKLFMPSDLSATSIELLAYRDTWARGQLDNVGHTEKTYTAAINKCLTSIELSIHPGSHTTATDKTFLRRQQMELKKLKMEISATASIGGIRECPPACLFYGDSQVGKSGLMEIAIKIIGEINGFETGDRQRYYIVPGDEYESGYTSETTVVIQDDAAAEKVAYRAKKDARVLLDWVNTVATASVQAEIEKKGTIARDPKFFAATTNVADLDMLQLVNCFDATVNRLLMIECVVNPKYADELKRMDSSKLPSEFAAADSHYLRAYTFVPNNQTDRNGIKSKNGYKKEYKSEPLLTKDFFEKVFIPYVKKKTMASKMYVDSIKRMRSAPMCSTTHVPVLWCSCCGDKAAKWLEENPPIKPEQPTLPAESMTAPEQYIMNSEVGITLFSTESAASPHFANVIEFFAPIESELEKAFARVFTNQLAVKFDAGMAWSLWTLSRVVTRNFMLACFAIYYFITLIGILMLPFVGRYRGWLAVWCSLSVWIQLSTAVGVYRVARRLFLKNVYNSFINAGGRPMCSLAARFVKVGAPLFSTYMGMRTLQYALSPTLPAEGNLVPKTVAEVVERNKEENMWLQVNPKDNHLVPPSLVGMTLAQARKQIGLNLVRIGYYDASENYVSVNCLVVCNRIALVPKHFLVPRFTEKELLELPLRCVRNAAENGGTFKPYIQAVKEVSTDCLAVVLTSTPNFKDITHLITEVEHTGSKIIHMFTRDVEGSLTERTARYTYAPIVRTTAASGPGSMHTFDMPSAPGHCGSPLVSGSHPFQIIALHSGGDGVGSCAFAISRSKLGDLKKTFTEGIYEAEALIPAPVLMREVNVEYFGKKLFDVAPINPRAAVNFSQLNDRGEHGQMDVIAGTTFPTVTPHSQVRKSMLSDLLTDYGRPRLHGPPKFRAVRNIATAYSNIQSGIKDVPEVMMQEGLASWLTGPVQAARRLGTKCQPFPIEIAINGIASSRHVKRINMASSAGIGLRGPKTDHFPLVATEPRNEFVAPDFIAEAVEEAMAGYERGEMQRPIYKSALKDEPTLVTKDKVRLFTVAPIVTILTGRMLVLPILSFLFSIPIESTMLQGVNCLNDEWDQVGKYFLEFPETNFIAGDFSKYDQRMSGQILRAVGVALRCLALELGYTETQALAVETYVADCAQSTLVLHGTLMMVDGYNMSGNVLTLPINGLANYILHSMAYNAILRENGMDPMEHTFRDNVHFGSVGDDSLQSVSSRVAGIYHMVSLQKFFHDLGIPYTDAAKSAVVSPLLHVSEVDFCKRSFSHAFDERVWTAPLSMTSIYKSIHNQMLSSTEAREIQCQTVDGALRELVLHGKDVFDIEASIIRRACETANISHLIPNLYRTWADWKDQFLHERFPELCVDGEEPSSTSQSKDETQQEYLELVTDIDIDEYQC